jgi:hypothetical protein
LSGEVCKSSIGVLRELVELVMRLGYGARLVVPLLAPDQIAGALVVRGKALRPRHRMYTAENLNVISSPRSLARIRHEITSTRP